MLNHETLKEKLCDLFSGEKVHDDLNTLRQYEQDMTENKPVLPSFVVQAQNVEQVQQLLILANEYDLSITPRVAGTNLGGLTIPAPNGIILDLRQLNRIREVNEQEQYALIEPGVTFDDMRVHLQQYFPHLRIGYPLAPPEVSVVCNALCQGLINLSLCHGSVDEWINGLEVVLPTGELVRTGSMALSSFAFARVPLPDLSGLFIGFQGTTGVVTCASMELWPTPAVNWRGFVINHSLEGSYQVLRELAKQELCDDLGGISWPAGKMLFGITRPIVRDPNEPEFFLYLDLSGRDPKDLQEKRDRVEDIIEKARAQGFDVQSPLPINELVKINPSFEQFATFPTRLSFLLDHEGGGLTWIGLYGPSSQWEEASRAGEKIMLRYGVGPTMVSRPMKGGHFCVLRFITLFDKRDEKKIDSLRNMQKELAEMALDYGFVPYKAPPWVVREVFSKRIDKGFASLLYRVKKLLDPKGIMNPGKWDLTP